MQIIKEIGLQAIEILTLICGVLGITLSLLLAFSPKLTKSLSNILNRKINFDDKINILDKEIEIEQFFYNHHILIGLVLIIGSAFSLSFFFFSLDIAKFTKVFLGTHRDTFIPEIIINSAIWIGKTACLFALFFGILLVFAPGKMRRIESKLNSWFETKSIFEKLDKTSRDIDSFIFRHPVLVGLTGAVLSFFLLSLSIINLLD
jgi:hypothetical protein